MSETREGLRCDMEEECVATVTHIDNKGFAYCTEHGIARRTWMPCRQLRPWELRRLLRSKPLARY